jgi:hypothetical protein
MALYKKNNTESYYTLTIQYKQIFTLIFLAKTQHFALQLRGWNYTPSVP